jgi:hypothetical protein
MDDDTLCYSVTKLFQNMRTVGRDILQEERVN